ncbi:MAG: hypothetical protein ABIN89_17740 [Chitinophagaceae bacterium]
MGEAFEPENDIPEDIPEGMGTGETDGLGVPAGGITVIDVGAGGVFLFFFIIAHPVNINPVKRNIKNNNNLISNKFQTI